MVDRAVIDQAVERIVSVAQPDRIVLFGSRARAHPREDSDIDLLVIKSGQFHKRALVGEVYCALIGVGAPVDIVIVTPEEIERYRDKVGPIVGPALEEGRTIYEREKKTH